MGIKINVQTKNDYSYLFNNMSKDSNGMDYSFLSDYATIKSGSYSKLMKAYYKSSASDEVKSLANDKIASVSRDDSATLSEIQKNVSKVKDSVSELSKTGEDSVLEGDDKEKAYKAVSEFIDNYNAMIKSGENSMSSSINGKTQIVESTVNLGVKSLAKAGITVNADKSLSIDKDTFMKAEKSDVKDLFQGSNSLGGRVSSQAELISKAADTEASKSNTYNSAGSYTSTYNVGNLYNSLF